MTRKRFKRVTFCLTEEEYAKLKRIAHRNQMNFSQFVRGVLERSVVDGDKAPVIAKSS